MMKCVIRDGEIHYEVRGSGKPMLVLHGGYLDHQHMVDCIEPSFDNDSNWKRIYPDLPGHGQTTIADSIENHDQVLDVLSEFMSQICPNESFALVGESRGGFLARGFAAKEPDRVDGLLLIVPARHSATEPLNLPPQVTLQRADELLPGLAEAEIVRFQKLVVQSQVILEKIRRYKIPAVELANISYQKRLNQNYQFSFDLDDSKYVYPKPTLVLLGRYDSEVGFLDTVKAIENYPRATYAILDKAGHSLAWEQPKLLRALVVDWIARVEEYVK